LKGETEARIIKLCVLTERDIERRGVSILGYIKEREKNRKILEFVVLE